LGQDFDGIIGCDFIKEFVVEIDYQAKHIKLYDKDKFVYSGPGESIPIQVNSAGHPILEAEVTPIGSPATKGRFVLDIGSGGALALHSPFVAERQLLAHQPKTIKALGGGAGGEIKGQIGRVTELKIGTFRIKNPITMFSEDKSGAFANTELLGNIGTQITSRFKLFLDYGRNRIIFEPNAAFAKPFDRAFDGMSLMAEGKDYRTFRVREVIPETPAAEAGLQVNDIIIAIDKRPATEFNLSQIHEMFEQQNSYRLTVRRGEQTLEVKLTPRRIV
jgi:membrane-associated protease RseP (regulator of RpoE activity)